MGILDKHLLYYFSSHLCHCSDVAMWRSDFALAVGAVLTSAAKNILFGFSLFKKLFVFPINLNIIISTITVIVLNTVITVMMIISLVTWNGLKGWEGESGLGAGWGPEVRRLRFKTIKTVKILGL